MSQSPTTHLSMIAHLQQPADEAAWGRFADLYGPLVYGYFRRRSLQDADAADLTQEVLEVVARRVDVFQHNGAKGAFRSWLFTICRHKLKQFLTRQQAKPMETGGAATLDLLQALPAPDDDQQRWRQEHQQRLFAWAAEKVQAVVDEATWRAFWQTAVEGRPAAEVAGELGKSVGVVYVAKSRVIARLREIIERYEDE